MKVYIVLAYNNDLSRIVNVYATKEAADASIVRQNLRNDAITFHVIKKTVKGLHGINFKVDGKKRFLEAEVKIQPTIKKRKMSNGNK